MKTKKYFLESEAIEVTMISKLEITKKQYDAMTKDLEKQLVETKDYECPLEKKTHNYDFEKTQSKVNVYEVGCYRIWLTMIECKKGYVFR